MGRYVIGVVHSSAPCKLDTIPSGWRDVAYAVIAAAKKVGQPRPLGAKGILTYLLQESSGYAFVVENNSNQPVCVQVDSGSSVGCVSTREDGATYCVEVVPPSTKQVVLALSESQNATQTNWDFASMELPMEASACVGVGNRTFDVPVLITELSNYSGTLPPDPELLAKRQPSATPKDACNNTMDVDDVSDDEDNPDLLAAIQLSMSLARPTQSADSIPSDVQSSGSKPESKGSAKEKIQAFVKKRFEFLVSQGVQPNEAAGLALKDAQKDSI